MAERSRIASASRREIGPLPACGNPARRTAAAGSFRQFCESYFPGRFPLAWSVDHLRAIDRIEECVHGGGQFVYAMPRGSGKTTLAECAALYATMNGHRRFVMLVCATESHAGNFLESIKSEIENNDLLSEDYPEVCYPVRKMEGIHNRAHGQTLDGKPTRIQWSSDNLVFPTVAGFPASGAVVRVAGITGAVRGQKFVGVDGKPIRPDLAILDDPQTDESARSASQNATREAVIMKAVLGLAGPKKKIAAVMPCTVITPGDLADRFLDKDRHPAWQGERSAMVEKWPDASALWDQYADIRRESLREGNGGRDATEFYRRRRQEMDAGSVVAWAERFNEDELSALQNAYNLRIDRGDRAFFAEFQNAPMPETTADESELSADYISKRSNRLPRGTAPPDATRLTAFIDVGGKVMYWAIVAWSEKFAGSIIDYGTNPKQTRAYFTAADARPSLVEQFPTHDETARVFAGLRSATESILSRTYPRESGGEMRVDLCGIDAGWLPDVVHQFCRQSAFHAQLIPTKGYAVTASGRPIDEWTQKVGDRAGPGWRITPVTGSGRGRLCYFDPNQWKTFVATRLLTPDGGAGCLHLFGEGRGEHQLFADHMTSEYRTKTTGRGRTVDEWKIRPERNDNHWLDCVTGCAVAASIHGLRWDSAAAGGVTETPRVQVKLKMSEMYARKHGNKHRS